MKFIEKSVSCTNNKHRILTLLALLFASALTSACGGRLVAPTTTEITTYSGSGSGTGTLTATNSLPVITPLANASYPLDGANPPLIQGNSYTLATTSDPTGHTVTLSCTVQTSGLSTSDPNYFAGGTNCSSLPTITASGTPSTTVIGKLPSSTTTGSISWTPTLSQRGTYIFSFTATNGTDSATPQTVAVTVRENSTTSNLISGVDALFADTTSAFSTVPSGPYPTSATSSTSWHNLLTNPSNGALTMGTSQPWLGSGQCSATSVDPYRLSFNGTNDSMSLGTALNSATEFGIETWVMPSGTPSPGSIIASNGGITGNGMAIRQSTIPPGRAEFVVGQKYYSYQNLILSDHPIGYWPMGETTGSTATDLSAWQTNGTYSGSYTLAQTGIPGDPGVSVAGNNGTSVSFNGGSSDQLTIPATINPWSGSFSVEFWTNSTTNSGTAFYNETLNASGLRIIRNYNGHAWRFDTTTGSGGTINLSSTGTPVAGWEHVVATFVPNTQSPTPAPTVTGTAKIYLNGVATTSASTVKFAIPTTTSQLMANGAISTSLTGKMQDLAIYNYALSQTQVTNHYQTGLTTNANYVPYPGNAVLADNPIGYWRLNETSGTVAKDYSGNLYDGTYVGSPGFSQTGPLANDPSSSAVAFPSPIPTNSPTYITLSPLVPIPVVTPTATPVAAGAFSRTAWVYPDTGSNRIFWDGSGSDLAVSISSGGSHTITIQLCGTTLAVASSHSLQTWYHIAITYDPNLSGGTLKFYQNGTLANSFSGKTAGCSQSSPTISHSWGGNTFIGRIADVAFYRYALSPTQIANQYNSGNGAGWWFCQSRSSITSSPWSFLSAVFDGTTSQLFVNGKKECQVNPTLAASYSGSGISTTLAANPDRSGPFWSGMLANFKIFGTTDNITNPLPTPSILADFNAQANRFRQVPLENIVTSGLVLNLDAANAQQGIAPYSSGCGSTALNWFDLSSGANNGTLTGFPTGSCSTDGWQGTGTRPSPSPSPYVLKFNGTSDYVTLNSNLIGNSTSMTLTAWVYSAWNDCHGEILYNKGNSVNSATLGFQVQACNTTIVLRGSGNSSYQTAGILNSNLWNHIAVTIKPGSGNTATGSIYINAGPPVTASGLDALTTNTNNLAYIGYGGTLAPTDLAKFSIATMQVYNTALTLQQIKQNCLAQEARFTLTPGTGSLCAAP